MGKRSDRKWTVALRPATGHELRKITKIVGLNGDGFSVLAPYHRARSGFLFKAPMDLWTLGKRTVGLYECVGFTAEDRAKLTYHTDGFAQFSGENPGKIISGRDRKTGEPKGLGLSSRPLRTPVVSGPSVGITVWGIEEFETAAEDEELIVFGPGEFYYRRCTPNDANAWHLAIFTFAVGAIPPLRFEGEQAVMQFLPHPIWGGVPGSVVELKAIYLQAEQVYLGLCVERVVVGWRVESGWTLHGPGDYTQNQSGHVLFGIYPRGIIPVEGRGSLDRIPLPSMADDSPERR
jgi:hypothetical protein